MSTFTKRKRNVFSRNKKDMKPFFDRDMKIDSSIRCDTYPKENKYHSYFVIIDICCQSIQTISPRNTSSICKCLIVSLAFVSRFSSDKEIEFLTRSWAVTVGSSQGRS